MKSLAKLPLLATTLLACTLITACGSGKKSSSPAPSASSSSSSGSTKPTPVVNKITVAVEGLNGKLELSNGGDILSISNNGEAQFPKGVEVGISYNVQIVSQPENQLCSVLYGRKLMVASGNLPVKITCSDGFGVGLDITKPADLSLKNLQVVSNYQRLGGDNDPALTVDSKIKTSQNSFIALKDAPGAKTFYVSYVYGTEQARISLDGQHTALALLVMEPSITDALRTHKLSVSAFYDLIAPLNAQKNRQMEGDLKKLADEITRQVDKNADLFTASASLNPLIEKALISALDKIASLPEVVSKVSATAAADSGVEFSVQALSDTKVKIAFNNTRDRAIAINGLKDQTAPLVIDALVTSSLEQTVEAGKFYNLTASVEGPGKIGTAKASAAAFQAAVTRSSLVDYFTPSLIYFSGGKNLTADLALDCLNAENEKELSTAANSVWSSIQTLLEQDNYYKPYHVLAEKFRAHWTDADHMDELLSCPSLGLSGLSQAEKQIAKIHLTKLFTGFNTLRDSASIKEDLFRTAKQSALVNALVNSAAQSQWNFTNAFTLDIKLPAQVDDETEAEFSARCLDATKKETSCALKWAFEETTLSGSAVKYLFKKPNNQIVTVVATGSNGVQISQALEVRVQRKGSAISLSKKDVAIALDTGKPLEFDAVFVGTKLPQTLVLKNTGNAPLVISAITVEGAGFSVNLDQATIGVGETRSFEVSFSPDATNNYTGSLSILSNDKSLSSIKLILTGVGTPAVSVGKYSIMEDQIVRELNVADKYDAAISGDEEYANIQLFGLKDSLYPKIQLNLFGFTGPGTYPLYDANGNNCLASYIAARDFNQLYCTTAVEGGSLVVTELSAETFRIDYDFYAVNCTNANGGTPCTRKVIQLRGSTEVAKSVLIPAKFTAQ